MGDIRLNKGEPFFAWSHSYSRVFPHLKNTKYDPGSSFMQFAAFDVENRPRVKCVTASHGKIIIYYKMNKAGLQPVSRPVEQILGAKMCSKNV